MLESLLNEVAELKVFTFSEKSLTQVLFCEICEIVKNTYFEEHLQATASKASLFVKQPKQSTIEYPLATIAIRNGKMVWKHGPYC